MIKAYNRAKNSDDCIAQIHLLFYSRCEYQNMMLRDFFSLSAVHRDVNPKKEWVSRSSIPFVRSLRLSEFPTRK